MAKAMRRYAQMSDEIEHLDVELTEMLGEIRQGIEALDFDPKKANMKPDEKQAEIAKLKASIDKAQGVFRTFKVELRELGREELAEFDPKKRAHQATLDELTRNLNYAATVAEKEALVGDRPAKPEGPNARNAAELIEAAKETQEKDAMAVQRMNKLVADSEVAGIDTNIKLKQQTEQLKNIHADVNTVSANMKVAEKLLNQIGRRLVTDKLIACVILLLLLGIIGILVVKSLGLDKSSTDVEGAGGQYYAIDCSLDITKTYRACQDLLAKQEEEQGGG
mmetsp:Transcript_56152/g.114831  ORF Transcript_56152/g.114831 Transcript_56152/m.114831 type:complete len:279 (-) Transcript_56152:365-1201(-)|eukprot:CAMPEP_0181343190 /NCGR_PEP_ID=MMETSP1101-20121128/31446_1 /TAXON_ID=46948 /ORGANISM="Rhodomonas abbreviata, Strain Caron Lab Isolate" /LENGTH=278 /DNA_ID=CAMNT_0023454787 /DNA_START=112 /DNA_END=948 /DNA_ORIENTATION=-